MRLFTADWTNCAYSKSAPSTLEFQNLEFKLVGFIAEHANYELPKHAVMQWENRSVGLRFDELDQGVAEAIRKNGMAMKNPKVRGFYLESLKIIGVDQYSGGIRWFPCFYNSGKQRILSVAEIQQAMAKKKRIVAQVIEEIGDLELAAEKLQGEVVSYKGVYKRIDSVEISKGSFDEKIKTFAICFGNEMIRKVPCKEYMFSSKCLLMGMKVDFVQLLLFSALFSHYFDLKYQNLMPLLTKLQVPEDYVFSTALAFTHASYFRDLEKQNELKFKCKSLIDLIVSRKLFEYTNHISNLPSLRNSEIPSLELSKSSFLTRGSNVQLSFIGGKLFSYIIADIMFWNLTKASSGIMTQLRIELVKKIVYVEHLEIQKCQIYGASLENLSENILVESFNALFGLLYYAKGLEFCRSFLLQLIDECKQKFVQGSAHNENAGIMKHLDSFLRKENFDILRINHLKDLSSQKSSDLGMKLQEKRLDELEDHIGIDFQNKLLLLKCLIPESYHTSYPTNYGSNDRLELYGDSILDYLICELIVLFCPNADSEILDGARQHLTSNESLCGIAKSIRLHEFIVSRIPIREDSNSKVIADALEALFGAIQIEHGILACRIFVLQHFSNPLAKFLRDSRVKNARFCLEFAISRLLHNLGITAESANFPSHLFTLNITPKSDLLYCSVYLYDNTLLSEGIGITQEQAAISSSWGALSILLQKHAISLFSPTGHPPTLNYISRQKTHFLATYTQFEQMISFGYTSNINQNGFWAFTC